MSNDSITYYRIILSSILEFSGFLSVVAIFLAILVLMSFFS